MNVKLYSYIRNINVKNSEIFGISCMLDSNEMEQLANWIEGWFDVNNERHHDSIDKFILSSNEWKYYINNANVDLPRISNTTTIVVADYDEELMGNQDNDDDYFELMLQYTNGVYLLAHIY